MVETAWLLGVPVHLVDRAQALSRIESLVGEGGPHLVLTADAAAVVTARRDAEFRRVWKQCSLVTADGAGIVRALGWIGRPAPERVSGVDLVSDVCGLAAARGWKVYLLGAKPGVADAAADNLRRRHPGLQVAGCEHGYFADEEEVVRRIAAAAPEVLFIGMGMPRQEKWFWQHRDRLGARVAMGVGGSFDVLSGRVRRAPEFFQRHGLEWLYRFSSKASNRAKIAVLPAFGLLALAEARRRRRLARKMKRKG